MLQNELRYDLMQGYFRRLHVSLGAHQQYQGDSEKKKPSYANADRANGFLRLSHNVRAVPIGQAVELIGPCWRTVG